MPFPLLGGLIAGGASLIGSIGGALINSSSQEDANKLNADLTREGWDEAREESARNRTFQQEMSNTAYQRSMADLKAAGLNPMLAFSQGGAGQPSGNSASMSGGGSMQSTQEGEALSEGGQSAVKLLALAKELEQKDSQIELTKASKQAADAQAALNRNSARKVEEQIHSTKLDNSLKEIEVAPKAVEGKYRYEKARTDLKYLDYDAGARRVREGLGVVNDAKDVINPLRWLPKGSKGGGPNNPTDSSGRTRAEVERDNYKKRLDSYKR